MNYTKAYRHRIYKKALLEFDNEPCGLCALIKHVNPDPEHIYIFQTREWFHELAEQKPRHAAPSDLWWSVMPRGHAARRRALVRCIELTAPTPRKKP
jgi:hypothetical protein